MIDWLPPQAEFSSAEASWRPRRCWKEGRKEGKGDQDGSGKEVISGHGARPLRIQLIGVVDLDCVRHRRARRKAGRSSEEVAVALRNWKGV